MPPFTKDNLGGYKLYYLFSQENKIIYVNYFFNLLDGYIKTHFPINDYNHSTTKLILEQIINLKLLIEFFFSSTARDYELYQSKKYIEFSAF